MSYRTVLADLKTKLDTETHIGEWLMIDQERINAFAKATLDDQWIHVDAERASRESPFGGTVAHGYLSLSLLPYLAARVSADGPRFAGAKLAVNYGLNRVRFPSAVRVGARIRARTRLISVDEIPGECLQIINLFTIEIEGAPKPACIAETVARIYFDA